MADQVSRGTTITINIMHVHNMLWQSFLPLPCPILLPSVRPLHGSHPSPPAFVESHKWAVNDYMIRCDMRNEANEFMKEFRRRWSVDGKGRGVRGRGEGEWVLLVHSTILVKYSNAAGSLRNSLSSHASTVHCIDLHRIGLLFLLFTPLPLCRAGAAW